MPIRYRVQQVANTPGKYYAQVVEEGVDDDAAAIRGIAEKTQQTEAVVGTVLEGAGLVIVESILAGRGFSLPGIGKVTFSIEAKLDTVDAPLPEERRVRARVALKRSLVDTINDQVQFERLPPDNLNPIIQTVTVENGVITALTAAALITLRGARLECDPTQATQGVFVQAPNGTTTKVPTAKIKSHTDGQIEFFWPTGLTVNTDYSVFMKGAARNSSAVRTSNTVSGFHNA